MNKPKILTCKRCLHVWASRINPKYCAKCRTPYWNTERKLDYVHWKHRERPTIDP